MNFNTGASVENGLWLIKQMRSAAQQRCTSAEGYSGFPNMGGTAKVH